MPGTDQPSRAYTSKPSRLARLCYLGLAYACVGLGLAGVVLPLVPTTPFLLLAAWAASRGSPRLHRWLYEHPYIGRVLLAWERERAVPRSAKISGCLLLVLSLAGIWWFTPDWRISAVAAVLFTGLASFLLTRPEPSTAVESVTPKR